MAISSINSTFAVFNKEIKSEFRTRYTISAVLLFVLTTISILVFSTAGLEIDPAMSAGLIWVIVFFTAMTGLAKVFVSEEERGTSLLLQLSAGSTAVFLGKLIFNIILSLALNLFAVSLYFLFSSKGISVLHWDILATVLILGSIGIASASTIISAIIAKANTKNALFPVLSFPILLPVLLLCIETTRYSFDGKGLEDPIGNFLMIISYCGILITVSYLLFDIIWKE